MTFVGGSHRSEVTAIPEAATAEKLLPAPPGARRLGREIAAGVSDAYTDDDWRRILNRMSPDRAAAKISRRPLDDRQRLLNLVAPDRRAEIERFLTAFAA